MRFSKPIIKKLERIVYRFMSDTYGKFEKIGEPVITRGITFIRYEVKKNKPYKVDRNKSIIVTIDSGMVITVYEDVNRFAASEY